MSEVTSNRKLSEPQRMQALALMARGDTTNQVAEFIASKYGIQISAPSLNDLRIRHKDTLEAMRSAIQEDEVNEVKRLIKTNRKILKKRLDRADHDETAMEELDRQYRDGEIEAREYKRKKETLLRVSITELSGLSKNLHDQTKLAPGEVSPPLPSGPASPQATEAIVNAIKNGDEVELQRLILNPKNPT